MFHLSVAELAGRLAGQPPRLGRTRLIAVDGRSGSGKTWLAGELAGPLGAPVIHMDDLYPGWDGPAAALGVLTDWVVGPLERGQAARWRRFDWELMEYAEWHSTAADVVLVEGCGSVRAALAPVYAARVWVEAPPAARERRLRARADWAVYEPHARQWAEQEDELYRTEHTRQRCDIVVENLQPGADQAKLVVHLRGGARSAVVSADARTATAAHRYGDEIPNGTSGPLSAYLTSVPRMHGPPAEFQPNHVLHQLARRRGSLPARGKDRHRRVR
ncbi:MAG: hypothetical protein JO016_16405 [Actinobacteria bacterium]|nr:hypothetical protein [Actinomycetota bacterium]